MQLFISSHGSKLAHLQPEQQLFVLRKVIERELKAVGIDDEECYFCSLSSKTLIYKGQLTPPQVKVYFKDLQREDFRSYMALVHSRFSTNTFPSWNRAQPMRLLGHNGGCPPPPFLPPAVLCAVMTAAMCAPVSSRVWLLMAQKHTPAHTSSPHPIPCCHPTAPR